VFDTLEADEQAQSGRVFDAPRLQEQPANSDFRF
jgi:hypothetical protein